MPSAAFPSTVSVPVELPGVTRLFVVVSGASIITDATGEAVGLMHSGVAPGQGLATGLFSHPGPPPLDFPPCMVRTAVARDAGFNPEFRRSQDSDFLIRVMLGKRYAVSSVPVYAYSQAEAAGLDKTLEGYRFRLRSYREYRESYPLHSRVEMAKTYARMGVYTAAGWLGAEHRLIEKRWQRITPEARAAYETARDTVTRAANMKEAS